MAEFKTFFLTGWHHIIAIDAYDHLLFVMVLCAAYQLQNWKQILVIITAFTLGHSVTLVLSAMGIIPSDPYLIQVAIPCTIMLTSLSNVTGRRETGTLARQIVRYVIAMFFGLIHGLAFASDFTHMMYGDSLLLPLFAFNLGIEAGQVAVVAGFMFLVSVYVGLYRGDHVSWNTFVSGAGFGIAAVLLLEVVGG